MSTLLIDADDTLWENNIYFEQAFDDFVDFLNHSHLTAPQIRDIFNEIELTNARIHAPVATPVVSPSRPCRPWHFV